MPKRCRKGKHKPVCIDSRPEDTYRRRRYRCAHCGRRWSTVEVEVEMHRGGPKGIDLLREQLGAGLTDDQLKAIRALVESFIEIMPTEEDEPTEEETP